MHSATHPSGKRKRVKPDELTATPRDGQDVVSLLAALDAEAIEEAGDATLH